MMKYSIRVLLIAVAFIGMALSGFKYGGWLAWATTGLIAALFLAMVILVFVSRGAKRAAAIGFLVPFCAYVGIHYFSKHDESNIYDSRMPTTQLLRTVFDKIMVREYYDRDSDEILIDFDLEANRTAGPARRRVSWNQIPERHSFAVLGHAFMALILGGLGAAFAIRVRDDTD